MNVLCPSRRWMSIQRLHLKSDSSKQHPVMAHSSLEMVVKRFPRIASEDSGFKMLCHKPGSPSPSTCLGSCGCQPDRPGPKAAGIPVCLTEETPVTCLSQAARRVFISLCIIISHFWRQRGAFYLKELSGFHLVFSRPHNIFSHQTFLAPWSSSQLCALVGTVVNSSVNEGEGEARGAHHEPRRYSSCLPPWRPLTPTWKSRQTGNTGRVTSWWQDHPQGGARTSQSVPFLLTLIFVTPKAICHTLHLPALTANV